MTTEETDMKKALVLIAFAAGAALLGLDRGLAVPCEQLLQREPQVAG